MSQFIKLIIIFCLLIFVVADDLHAGEIHVAAAAGDLNKVRELIEADTDLLESKDNNGYTPLMIACKTLQVKVANYLIDKGTNVNAKERVGMTPLFCLDSSNGKDESIDLILCLIAGGAKEDTIVERNYGKAPQLTAPLKEGEAYLWFLGQNGYVVKTREHLLIIDPGSKQIDESPEAGLVNGNLNPTELAGQKITVLFIESPPVPNMNRDQEAVQQAMSKLLDLAKRIPDVDFVMSYKPETTQGPAPHCHVAVPHQDLSVGDLKVHTIPATGGGLAYLIEVDGLKLFYAVYHVCNDASQSESYRKEIDFLKPFGPVDIVFLPVVGHAIPSDYTYNLYPYLLDQLSPKAIYLYHDRAWFYAPYAQVLRARHVWVEYPETASCGNRGGDRFHYLRD